MDIGTRVREVRKDFGMSQAELARRVGTSRNHIVMIEVGSRTPSVALLERIAEKLRIEPAELLREPVPKAPAPSELGQPETGPSDQGTGEEQLPKTVAEVREKFLPIAAWLNDYSRVYEQLLARGELTDDDAVKFARTAVDAKDFHTAVLEGEIVELGYVLDRDRKLNQKQQLYDLSVLRPAFARYYGLMHAIHAADLLPDGEEKTALAELAARNI